MRLKAPFETSFGITHDRPVLLVELQADGCSGWSEVTATEGPFYNSESIDIGLACHPQFSRTANPRQIAFSRF